MGIRNGWTRIRDRSTKFSDNHVETSVDSQWVTWSNTKKSEKMNLTNKLALRLKWVQIVIWKAYLSSILKPKIAPESAD